MMGSRTRRSVSRPCYTEQDSFAGNLSGFSSSDSSPRKQIVELQPTRGRGRPRKSVVSSDASSDQNSASVSRFQIVSNNYPKIVIGDVSAKSERALLQTAGSKSAPVTPRRSIRPKRKSAVFREAEQAADCLKKLTVESDDDDDSDIATPIEKQSSLFTEEDVEGKKIFGFKTTHKKQNLLKKAFESVLETPKKQNQNDGINRVENSPRTPKSALKLNNANTPRSTKRVSIQPSTSTFTPKSLKFPDNHEKTPYKLRQKIKKQLETLTNTDDENSDFSASDSEFCPSDTSDEDISDEKSINSELSDDSSVEQEKIHKPTPKKMPYEKTPSKTYGLRTRGEKDPNFIIKSDNYFHMHGNKKVVTSNHTLERLKNPRFTEEKLQNILKNQIISDEHKCAIKELLEDHKKLFDKWLYYLSEGFSILLYGVGSKEKLIQEFQKEKLSTYPCIVINGYFPSLTLKDILESIGTDLLGISSLPTNPYEAVDFIESEMSELENENLFLLIHNLDGALLRNHKSQHVLSKLAKIRNIHLIASIDHINAPLFWDHAKLSDYNFSWWDTTSFLSYMHETSYESSLLVHKSGIMALSSLKNVYHSLTSNAKGIYMILVKDQLKNSKTPHYQGLPFKDLYWSAREAFLVSSDLALRAQLTEFLDHKLVKNKRTVDGTENLIIPIDNTILLQFMEQNEEQ